MLLSAPSAAPHLGRHIHIQRPLTSTRVVAGRTRSSAASRSTASRRYWPRHPRDHRAAKGALYLSPIGDLAHHGHGAFDKPFTGREHHSSSCVLWLTYRRTRPMAGVPFCTAVVAGCGESVRDSSLKLRDFCYV